MSRLKNRVFQMIVHHKKSVLLLFGLLCFFSVISMGLVRVNYDLAAYLPADAKSTQSISVMEEEFESIVPNARMMFENVTLAEAMDIKRELLQISGVKDVLWLDSTQDINAPLQTQDKEVVEAFYKDNKALFTVTLSPNLEIEAMNTIREKYQDQVSMAGPAINIGASIDTSDEEVLLSTSVIVPLCFLILLLTTTSYFEPVLFMGVIGVAILINMGTNIIFGEISFVTHAAQSILQLAVSMDYSIFLLHRFMEKRQEGLAVEPAMLEALSSSFASITASGITTVIGFAALIFMRFRIGSDMGLIMAKAVLISLFCVLVLMPILVISFNRWIERTKHPSFLPSFRGLARLVYHLRLPMVLFFLLLVVPSFLAKDKNEFYYGASKVFGETTQVGMDAERITQGFGKANNFVLMVPRGEIGKERLLSQELQQIPEIKEVISYVDTAGAQVPVDFLDSTTINQLVSPNYSRMILVLDLDYEGNYAFSVVDQIEKVAEKYYPDQYYMAGETVNTFDLKKIILADNPKVNALAIGAVFLVLMMGFQSFILPILLVLTIETAIWINVSVPYFTSDPMFFIAYLIVSSIQLGATVDYAILYTNRYLENRGEAEKEQALENTTMNTTASIMTSGLIMTVGCMILGFVSHNEVLSQLGILIGRGALLSMAAVLFVLPALLYYCDGIIKKTRTSTPFNEQSKEGL